VLGLLLVFLITGVCVARVTRWVVAALVLAITTILLLTAYLSG